MSSSVRDINLTIISNGVYAYYACVKGIGSIFSELDFGIYSDTKPDAKRIFSFIEDTDWEDCIEAIYRPLGAPVYGFIVVNFDTKTISFDNGYSVPNFFFIDWIIYSLVGKSGLLSQNSALTHFKEKRMYYVYRDNTRKQIDISVDELLELPKYFFYDSDIDFIAIDYPDDWKLISD